MTKRLNIKLDAESFAKLEKIKTRHRDESYTATIKRAISYQFFTDEKREEGFEILLGNPNRKGDLLYTIVFPS